MQRKSFAEMECPIARSIEQVGDGWTLLILRNAFLGARRFADFESRLGIPPTTLARRLERLVSIGLFTRHRYEARPPREEYELTDKGLALLPLILTLAAWGNRWLMPDNVAIECMDPKTKRALDPVLVDRSTRRELLPGEVALRAGPCASPALREGLRRGIVLGAGAPAAEAR
jgi:DNA-binding HxlR family transcriptional regulator